MKSSKPGNGRAFYNARYRSISWFLACLVCVPLWADLASVKAELNLERRSERAVEYANEALTAARKEYEDGKIPEFQARVKDVAEAAEMCIGSLEENGRDGRRHPKYFKRGELSVRTLLRRIENLRQEVSIDDREQVEQLKARVETVHDRLLQDLLEKKK